MEFFLIICQNWDFLKSYIESLLFVGRGGMNPRASYKPGMCYTTGLRPTASVFLSVSYP